MVAVLLTAALGSSCSRPMTWVAFRNETPVDRVVEV